MRRALLDVNVLLAIHDRRHVRHRLAAAWLQANIDAGWASCAITQNGFVRVASQPSYPNPLTAAAAAIALRRAALDPAHEFWPCDVALPDPGQIDASYLVGPKQVTDAYLLALAAHHGGRFVTFDQRVDLRAAPAATAASLEVIAGEA